MKQTWSRLERRYPALLAYRRKVDADYLRRDRSFGPQARGASPFPLLGALVLVDAASLIPDSRRWLLLAASMPFIALQLFNFWRAYRMDKAKRYWGGRDYERRGRYDLPPEYHDSEDALLAARRRKRSRALQSQPSRPDFVVKG